MDIDIFIITTTQKEQLTREGGLLLLIPEGDLNGSGMSHGQASGAESRPFVGRL